MQTEASFVFFAYSKKQPNMNVNLGEIDWREVAKMSAVTVGFGLFIMLYLSAIAIAEHYGLVFIAGFAIVAQLQAATLYLVASD